MPVYTYICPDCRFRWERTWEGEPSQMDRCTRCAAYARLQEEPRDEAGEGDEAVSSS